MPRPGEGMVRVPLTQILEASMTRRFGRLVLAIAAGVLFGLVAPMAALADSLVTVDCGDGSPLSASADLATLTSLQASVQGMIDNPSGMSCTVSQGGLVAPTLTVAASSSSGNPFVVGGGRYDRGPGPGPMQGCGLNFGMSAQRQQRCTCGERGELQELPPVLLP